jgi:cytochrome c-type biogenesis protein CcmH
VTVLRSFWTWLAALLVVAALAVVFAPAANTQLARVQHLESLVRCPACEDLSVAQSTAPSSLAVRHQITEMVRRGRSDTTILTTIEDQYGSSILLLPNRGGLEDLLWIVPVAVVLLGAALFARLLRRRS